MFKVRLLCWLAIAACSGCGHFRQPIGPPYFATIDEPGTLAMPIPWPAPQSGSPCTQQFATAPTNVGTTATSTIASSAITVHDIQGVNAVRLLEALRLALAKARYAADKAVPQTVRENEVTITTEPISSGQFFFRHYITAEIHAKEIEVRVRTVLLDQNKNLMNNRPPQNVPDKVNEDILAALGGGIR